MGDHLLERGFACVGLVQVSGIDVTAENGEGVDVVLGQGSREGGRVTDVEFVVGVVFKHGEEVDEDDMLYVSC